MDTDGNSLVGVILACRGRHSRRGRRYGVRRRRSRRSARVVPARRVERERLLVALAPLGQGGQQVEGVRQRSERIALRAGGDGALRHVAQGDDGPAAVTRLLEPHRELGRDVARPVAVRVHQPVGHATMQLGPAGSGDAAVELLAVQRVREGVAPRDRAVGPLAATERSQQLAAARERRAAVLDLGHVGRQRRRDRRGGELGADDARGVEHGLVLGRQALDLLLDHHAEALGDADALEPRLRGGPRFHVDHQPLRRQLVHHAGHEERVAVGAAVEPDRQPVGERRAREARREERGRRLGRQQAERQLAAPATNPQLARERADRMLVHDGVGGPVRAEHHETSGVGPPGDVRQQVDGGMVAPVQVLEHDDQRTVRRQRLERVGHDAEHAIRGRYADPPLELLAFARREHARQLQQPFGGELAQAGHERSAVGAAAETAEALEDGQERLARAVLRHALSARDPRSRGGVACHAACDTRVEQGRLPDPGLAAHEHDLAPPSQGLVEALREASELFVAADQGRGRPRMRLRRRVGRARRLGDEAVASPVDRGDEPRRLGGVAERLAQLVDADLEHHVGHVGLRPERVEQLVLGDQLPGPLGQVAQQGEALRAQGNGIAVAPQHLVCRVDLERWEGDQTRHRPSWPDVVAPIAPGSTPVLPTRLPSAHRGRLPQPARSSRRPAHACRAGSAGRGTTLA